MRWAPIILVLLFSGCAGAKVIQSPLASHSNYAPQNESERVGSVQYKLHNSQSKNDKIREQAYQKMFESCGGPYQIVGERDSVKTYSSGGTSIPIGGYQVISADDTDVKYYRIINFRCSPSKS